MKMLEQPVIVVLACLLSAGLGMELNPSNWPSWAIAVEAGVGFVAAVVLLVIERWKRANRIKKEAEQAALDMKKLRLTVRMVLAEVRRQRAARKVVAWKRQQSVNGKLEASHD